MKVDLEEWLDGLAGAGALIGGREATTARLRGWLPWLEAAVTDDAARAELLRLVALDARNLAGEGRPASVAITQVLLLEDAWASPSTETRSLVRLLIRVAADAFALGLRTAQEAEHAALLGRRLPVVPIADRWLGYLLGPMVPEVIDGVMARLLHAAAASGARQVALDIAGATAPNEVFFRTLEGFSVTNTGSIEVLTLTNAPDLQPLREALSRHRIPSNRVQVARLNDWLAAPSP